MEKRTLYRTEPKTADWILATELLFVTTIAVASVIREKPWFAAVCFVVTGAVLAWRFMKGPMLGPAIAHVGEQYLMFNDPVFMGQKQFALGDIAEIRIVGPRSERRIRVHSKSGAAEEAYRGLSGKDLARMVSFLRANLPANVTLFEDEPPGLITAIRGDF